MDKIAFYEDAEMESDNEKQIQTFSSISLQKSQEQML
jgi:hypothetical protein